MQELYLRPYRRFDRTSNVLQILWKLGDFIRKMREEKGWTQQTLADRAGLHKSAIVRLEGTSGRSDTATIESAARALGVSVADLYAHVEQATLFSNLAPAQQRHVLEYERRLLQRRQSGDLAPSPSPPPDLREPVSESHAPIQKRQRRR